MGIGMTRKVSFETHSDTHVHPPARPDPTRFA